LENVIRRKGRVHRFLLVAVTGNFSSDAGRVGRGMQVRVSKGADYSYIPRQRFAALPWYQCESVRPLAVDSDKADRLLAGTPAAVIARAVTSLMA